MEHTTDTAHENRLAGESSPYLRLHRHNPVDWYPWGEEALARARREDKPIFLSVGYSTCYWCHVMERESFSNERIAERMNEGFVNIKLDREERPDLDEIYMTATQILTGHGGWPNSVFLTPELKPFYAGTYFPPDDRHGRPGFPGLLAGLAEAWRTRRSEVQEQAEELARAMGRYLEERGRPGAAPPSPEAALAGVEALARRFDQTWGGFGGAPKFPTPSNLFLLLEVEDEDPEAAEMLAATLDQMARGGIYDQLAGGFHRYATDREWKIPHFEKMLYDNGLLLELYSREYARTGDPQAARVARQTAEFLAREMTSPEGAFWSAIDAETDGDEGAYYVWTREELESALGPEDAAFLAPLFGFDDPPFFEGDRYVLHLPQRLEEVADRRRMPEEELLHDLDGVRAKLLAARGRRKRPATDDKILADWNGMAIAGLASAGALLGEQDFLDRAARAADFVLGTMRPAGGPLLHAWRAGQGRIPAYLGDYAYLVRGLLALRRATGEERWLTAAAELTEEQIARLADPEGGFFVGGESPDVLFRAKEVFDGATPAGNAVAVLNLLELAGRTGEARWREPARAALRAFAPIVEQHPEAVKMLAVAARRYWETAPPEEGEPPAFAPAPARDALAEEAEGIVRVRMEMAEGDPNDPEAWRGFRLTLEIASGWHLQANPATEEHLVPTAIEAQAASLRNLQYPEPRETRPAFAERPLAVYEGEVQITGEVGELEEGARLLLTYQACDDERCLPPITRVARI